MLFRYQWFSDEQSAHCLRGQPDLEKKGGGNPVWTNQSSNNLLLTPVGGLVGWPQYQPWCLRARAVGTFFLNQGCSWLLLAKAGSVLRRHYRQWPSPKTTGARASGAADFKLGLSRALTYHWGSMQGENRYNNRSKVRVAHKWNINWCSCAAVNQHQWKG